MPYDPQLGMTVYDPLEAYRSGQPAAQAFSQAYEGEGLRRARLQAANEQLLEMASRQQGLRNYSTRLEQLMRQPDMTPEKAASQAYMENAHLIDRKNFGNNLTRFEQNDIRELLGRAKIIQDKANAASLYEYHMGLARAAEARAKAFAEQAAAKPLTEAAKLTEKAREFDAGLTKQTPEQKSRDDRVNALQDIRDLTQQLEADPTRSDLKVKLQIAKDKLETIDQFHPGGLETTITVGPQGTEVKRTRIGGAGAQPGALTTANTTAAQNTLDQSLRSIDTAEHLLPLIGPDTFGPRAYVEGWINDKVLANAFPQLASQKRATVEQLVSDLRETAVKTRKSDSNITQREVDQILRAVPETNTPINSPQNAINVTKALQKEAAARVILTAKKLRVPIPPGSTRPLEDTDLVRLAEVGLITAQEADSIRRNRQQP